MSNDNNVEQGRSNGGKNSILTQLLARTDAPTLILVALVGGSNLFVTKEDGRLTREEAIRVARQVSELHANLDDFERRQKETLDKLNEILRWQQNHP